jgi:uncharacterized membrane protein
VRAFFRDAFGGTIPSLERRTRITLAVMVLGSASLFATLALSRFATYHNETFDLAFYARMAWGEIHHDPYNPIVGASARGLHLVWILMPLGVIGAVFGQAPTLLVTQAFAVAIAALPLSRIGARRFGDGGAIVVALAWLLHPNVSHVATGEFHPGTVAALPLAWAADALDRRSGPGLLLGVFGVLACREDLGLVTTLMGLAAPFLVFMDRRSARGARADELTRFSKAGIGAAVGSLVYVLFFMLVLHPRYAPPNGSLELHFGHFGRSTTEVVIYVLGHPRELLSHLSVNHRLFYVPMICAPFALLPLVRPGFLLLAAPVIAINLLSEFPGTTDLDSHYLTPALPLIAAASVHGAAALQMDALRIGAALRLSPLVFSAMLAHALFGGTPMSLSFSWDDFTSDENTSGARAVLAHIPEGASVQAPDALLPHLAERRTLRRAPPPETNSAYVVFDAFHRRRYRHEEDLLRTEEEPLLRAWLARDDHALIAAGGDYLLLARNRDPRSGIGVARYVIGHTANPNEGQRLAACLGLRDARVEHAEDSPLLELELVARGPCPEDLALRIGRRKRAERVDLIADGLLSPAHFHAGDVIRSAHPITTGEAESGELHVGALRSSGARPEHADPMSIRLTLP